MIGRHRFRGALEGCTLVFLRRDRLVPKAGTERRHRHRDRDGAGQNAHPDDLPFARCAAPDDAQHNEAASSDRKIEHRAARAAAYDDDQASYQAGVDKLAFLTFEHRREQGERGKFDDQSENILVRHRSRRLNRPTGFLPQDIPCLDHQPDRETLQQIAKSHGTLQFAAQGHEEYRHLQDLNNKKHGSLLFRCEHHRQNRWHREDRDQR